MRAMASEHRTGFTPANMSQSAAEFGQDGPNFGIEPGFILEPARTGDHLAIHYFLQQVFGGPSAREYQAQMEEPGYTPAQRLVVRFQNRIVAHIRLAPGSMQTATGLIPIIRVCDQAVSPEYRRRGWGSALLQMSERIALQRGAMLMLSRSSQAALFARQGWFPCGWHSYSYADPRGILAELDRRRPLKPPLPIDPVPYDVEEIRVRRWKQTEYGALRRLYAESFSRYPGPLTRSDARWRWLIQREAFDQLYVAVLGKERLVLDEVQAHVLGYAFAKGDRMIELAAGEETPEARKALLTRVCRDAIEQGATPVRFDGPPDDPLHELIRTAGGESVHREAESGQWRLARVLDWPRFVRSLLLTPQVSRPLVIETHARNCPTQWFIVEPAGVVCENALMHLPRPADVVCAEPLLAQLLLGHADLAEAISRLWIEFRTDNAEAVFRELLPARPLWLPGLEDLLA